MLSGSLFRIEESPAEISLRGLLKESQRGRAAELEGRVLEEILAAERDNSDWGPRLPFPPPRHAMMPLVIFKASSCFSSI